MRYFIRQRYADGSVDELPVWNGPYGFETEQDAQEDLNDFIEDNNREVVYNGPGTILRLKNRYTHSDFFVEGIEMELPYNGAD